MLRIAGVAHESTIVAVAVVDVIEISAAGNCATDVSGR